LCLARQCPPGSKAGVVPDVRPAFRFRFSLLLPIEQVMLFLLLIALLSIAMIDTAVGVLARVGRR